MWSILSASDICLQFQHFSIPVDLIFNGLFLRFCLPYIHFFSFIFFSFLNRYAWSSNIKTPTIQQFFKYFKLLSHSALVLSRFFFSVCGLCYLLILFSYFFDNFFQVSFFRFFVCIWKDRWLEDFLVIFANFSVWFIISLCEPNSHALNYSWQNLNETHEEFFGFAVEIERFEVSSSESDEKTKISI